MKPYAELLQPAIDAAIDGHAVRPGVWQAVIPMADDGPLAHVRAIAIRLDPAQVRFDLMRRDDEVPGG